MPHTPVAPLTALQVASSRLESYLKAEAAILDNQAYEIAGRRLTRANLAEVQQGIKDLGAEISRLSGGARRRFGTITNGHGGWR